LRQPDAFGTGGNGQSSQSQSRQVSFSFLFLALFTTPAQRSLFAAQYSRTKELLVSYLEIDRKTYRLTPDQYMPEPQKKDMIVLHYTAGASAAGAFASWTTPVKGRQQRVATAYVVDLNGTIYEMFPPRSWAYHLGMNAPENPNWIHDRRSIGIEIVNPGPLRMDGTDAKRLNWYPMNFGARWCGLDEKNKYVKAPWRGFDYWASFPEDQAAAVRDLVVDLCARFGISTTTPPAAKLEQCDPKFFGTFKGIASHQNFRADKSDIGPAWDWKALAALLRPR
jgi:N-acetyl-anhydromuramyl-L-alanine amidase AmpD